MRCRLVASCASVVLGALLAAAPAAMADAPEVLRGRTRVGEYQPVRGGDVVAWQQNTEQRPGHYDVFAKPVGGEAFKVNPAGTNAANGSIAGGILVYQEWDGGRSDIRFFDLGTKTRRRPPDGVNSKRWEYWPKMDGGWLLLGRLNRNTRARQLILYDLGTETSKRLDRVRSRKAFLAPGQVNGGFAVWSRCAPAAPCNVIRYDIASDTKAVIENAGSEQYAPSVASDGTVFYARSRGGCGQAVRLFSQPLTGAATQLWRLPSGDNVSSTYLYENANGRQTLLFDHYACGQAASSDIWQMPDPLTFELAVTVQGGGTGTVTSDPAGIQCGLDCSQTFDPGDEVRLTANPGPGSEFSGWGGACSGTAPTCTVTMNGSQAVTASFADLPTLTVNVIGDGGAVTVGDVACTDLCVETYDDGTTVTLVALDEASWKFVAWGGACAAFTGDTCSLTLESDQTATATFETGSDD